MKLLVTLMVSFFTFSALASDRTVAQTLAKIEFNKNVKCELTKVGFALCVGLPEPMHTCYSTSTYACEGNESFTLKLRVKSFYNMEIDARQNVVIKTKIK
jgi:hypothetical protein